MAEWCLVIDHEHGAHDGWGGHIASMTVGGPVAEGAACPAMVGSATPTSTRRSVLLPPAQEQQYGLDPAVHVPLLAEPQLGKDRAGVLFHGPLGHVQRHGDR